MPTLPAPPMLDLVSTTFEVTLSEDGEGDENFQIVGRVVWGAKRY